QVWMAENLKTTHYTNGDAIPAITDNGVGSGATIDGDSNDEWEALGNNDTDKAYCWYDDDEATNKDLYGALYTYAAATNGDNSGISVQGACPTGWHIPSDAEWTELTNYLTNNGYGYEGSGDDIAKSMAATSGWSSHATPGYVGNDQASNNSSGFSALPGGQRGEEYGFFKNVGDYAFFWSATENWNNFAWYRALYYNYSDEAWYNIYKSKGYSVRCLKD
ncbi:MAG: hypothetical protein DRJ10_11905, partial [Bacteroidetes bacterium]